MVIDLKDFAEYELSCDFPSYNDAYQTSTINLQKIQDGLSSVVFLSDELAKLPDLIPLYVSIFFLFNK